jgi:inosose dehydratase
MTDVADRLATAPVTWGVWEMTIDRGGLLTPAQMLAVAGELGYRAIELGPIGYFGADAAGVRAALDPAGMALVGAFVELRFADADGYAQDAALLDATLEILTGASDGAPLLLADGGSPARRAASGKLAALAETALDAAAFAAAMDRLRRALERAAAAGVPVAFHPHAATYVETPAEIEALLEATAAEGMGICLDSGHALVGGGDPVAVAEACGDRITHLHLKDVDGAVLARLRAGEIDVDGGWEAGMFCPFGAGEVDLAAFLAAPPVRACDGWLVLEQDRMQVTPGDLAAVAAVERANREHVLAWAAA